MTVKTAVSLPEQLFAQVEKIAREENLSRSGVVALAIERFVQQRENRRLLARINAACPDPPDAEDAAFLAGARQAFSRSSRDAW